MHALPAATDWDRGKVAQAVAESDELVMELSHTELSAASEEFQRLAPRAAPLVIARRLPPAALAGHPLRDAQVGRESRRHSVRLPVYLPVLLISYTQQLVGASISTSICL